MECALFTLSSSNYKIHEGFQHSYLFGQLWCANFDVSLSVTIWVSSRKWKVSSFEIKNGSSFQLCFPANRWMAKNIRCRLFILQSMLCSLLRLFARAIKLHRKIGIGGICVSFSFLDIDFIIHLEEWVVHFYLQHILFNREIRSFLLLFFTLAVSCAMI